MIQMIQQLYGRTLRDKDIVAGLHKVAGIAHASLAGAKIFVKRRDDSAKAKHLATFGCGRRTGMRGPARRKPVRT